MKKVWEWIKIEIERVGKFLSDHVVPVAVEVTNTVKAAIDSGAVGLIETVADALTKSSVPTEIVGLIKLVIPKVLAFELAIKGLPTNPTEQDIIDFEQRVLDAFGVHFQKDKVYSTLTAQIILEVKALMGDGKITFAEAVGLAEDIYKDYKQDTAADQG